jgi:hypothetical protein
MVANKDKLNYADSALAHAIEKGDEYSEDPTEFTLEAFLAALMDVPKEIAEFLWRLFDQTKQDPHE